MKALKHSLKYLFTFTFVVGCQSGNEATTQPDPSEPESTGQLVAGPERAVSGPRDPSLGFRADTLGFHTTSHTHDAEIVDGIVTFTPVSLEPSRVAHPPMTLETTAISSNSGLIDRATSIGLDDGDVIVMRDNVEERLTNTVLGLHQEWKFTQPVSGDLTVKVSLGSYQYSSTTEQGLHFLGSDGMGIRYSHGIWISADGTEWPVPAVFEDGAILLTVPESVVAQTRFPAVLDPTVSSEVAADIPVAGPTGAQQIQIALAFDGTNYLAVWSDNRNGLESDIWGSRLSSTGAILDPFGIKIASTAGIQSRPSVTFAGGSFLVVWEDFLVAGGTTANLGAARISTAGAVTQLGNVAATAANETQPAIAGRADGTALVTWLSDTAVTGSVFNGTSFGGSFQIAPAATVERTGIAASTGDYLVTYSNATDLQGQLITTAGALSGAAFPVSAGGGSQTDSSITFDGTNFIVVWQNTFGTTGRDVFGSRVSTAGAVLDTHTEGATTFGGKAISNATNSQELPSVACVAGSCLVIWQDRRNQTTTNYDVFGQRLDANFALAGANFVIDNAGQPQENPVVAASGSDYFAVWRDLRDGGPFTALGVTVSTAGAVGTAAPIASGNNRESQPTLGRSGTNFGLFWSDSRVYGNNIMFVRFNSSGTKLDATALTASDATFAQSSPAASGDLGGNTLVAWSDARNGVDNDIFAARVSLATGAVLDATGIALGVATADQLTPAVASSGSVALVVWADRSGGTFDIHGAVVDAAGAVVVPDFVISNAASDQNAPAVTFDATANQFIVVWQDKRAAGVNHIFGSRVSTAGVVLDTAGVSISSAAVGQFTPTITSLTGGSFVAWSDRRNAGRQNIFGARVTGGSALTVLDANGIQISNVATIQSRPSASGQGTSIVVAWMDVRNGNVDIFGQQLNSNGTAADVEFAISATADDDNNPTLQALGGTSIAFRVAYASQRQDTSRVATRVIGAQATGGTTCSGPTQCASGFCVDGFCCDTACGGNHKPAGSAGSGIAGDCHGCAKKFTGQPDGICSPIPSNVVCRNYVSSFCDVREYCDGTSTTCGPDLGKNGGLTCNRSTNFPAGTGTSTCAAADAAGAPHRCL